MRTISATLTAAVSITITSLRTRRAVAILLAGGTLLLARRVLAFAFIAEHRRRHDERCRARPPGRSQTAGGHYRRRRHLVVGKDRRLPGFIEPIGPAKRPIGEDPWYNLWDRFRKHVIGIHYDELSKWAHEAGIPTDAIYSAQGLIHGDPAHEAFAVRIDSPSRDYDSAGVSVEGSIPRDGHLGAILYGRTARNDVELDNGHSLFATIERMDEGWAIVEYNNTDLRYPSVAPDYAMAYKTFRDAFNYGANEV